MTKEEKTHKLKLIMLILICKAEITRRNTHKTIEDSLNNAIDAMYWIQELKTLTSQITKN